MPPVLPLSRLHVQVAVEAHGGLVGVAAQLSQYDGRDRKTLPSRQLQREVVMLPKNTLDLVSGDLGLAWAGGGPASAHLGLLSPRTLIRT